MYDMRVLVLMLVIWLQGYEVVSDCDVKGLRATCTHLSDLDKVSSSHWDHLTVNNTGREALVSLGQGAFSGAPNVKYLTVDGWLENVQAYAFRGLNDVYVLTLINNKIKTLQPNVYSYAKISTIDIDNCGVEILRPGCFRNVKGLSKLNIYRNTIRTIRQGVFNTLDISELYLQYDEITSIQDGAFSQMPELSILSLRGNHLVDFDAGRVLGPSPKLVWLSLRENRIEKVTPAMIKDMPELMTLSLENNVVRVVEDGSFTSNHPKLEHIYFQNNSLEVLSPSAFASGGMPQMLYLYLEYNKLTYIFPSLLNRLPNLEQLCFGGNPLFCGCYTELVQWREKHNVECYRDAKHFSSGMRPACIPIHNDQCVYGDYSAEARNLVQHYIQSLPQYMDDP